MKKSTVVIISAAVALVLLATGVTTGLLQKQKNDLVAVSTTAGSGTTAAAFDTTTETASWFDWNAYLSGLGISDSQVSPPTVTTPGGSVVTFPTNTNGQTNYGPVTNPATVTTTKKKPTTTTTKKAPTTTEGDSLSDYQFTISSDTVRLLRYLGSDKTVVIPSSINGKKVTSIASGAFSGKSNIADIYIPNTVTSISGNPFPDCSKSMTIHCSVGSAAYDFADTYGFDIAS